MNVFILAALVAAAAAQSIPSVLLARPGSFQGNQGLTSEGLLQNNNFNQNQQVFFSQSQGDLIQPGLSTLSGDQFNQFQSSSSSSSFSNQDQNNQFQTDASFGQPQNSQSGTFFTQDQNTQFLSGSSLVGQNQNSQFQSGLSLSSQGQNQQLSGLSVSSQGGNGQFQSGSDQFQVGGGFISPVNGQFEPLNLPAGASLLLGSVDTSFQCADRPYGYYADEGNACRIFHVCNPYLFEDGRIETVQYSFMCGEGSVFDQKELTCVEQFAATPCSESSRFYSRNEEFGLPEEKL